MNYKLVTKQKKAPSFDEAFLGNIPPILSQIVVAIFNKQSQLFTF